MGLKGLKFTPHPWEASKLLSSPSLPPLAPQPFYLALSVNHQLQQWRQSRNETQACVGKALRKLNNVNKCLQIAERVMGKGHQLDPAVWGGIWGELCVCQAQGIVMPQNPQKFTLNSFCYSTSHFIFIFFTGKNFIVYQDIPVLDLFFIVFFRN